MSFVVSHFCPFFFNIFLANYFLASIYSSSSSLLILTLIEFLLVALGSIIYLATCSSLLNWALSPEFFNYLTLSAYLRVFIVFYAEVTLGETFPIMTVLQNPTKESFKTIVSLLPLNGVCPFPWSKARIHYLRASKDLFIYAPSILVCLLWSIWSAPLSLPAKSIKDIFVNVFFPSLIIICRIAWEREESAFVAFWEVTLKLLPY